MDNQMTKQEADDLQKYLTEMLELYGSEPEHDPSHPENSPAWQEWDRKCQSLTEQYQDAIWKGLIQAFQNSRGLPDPQFATAFLTMFSDAQEEPPEASADPSAFYLKPLASMPTAEMQTFLARLFTSAGGKVRKSTVTRSEQITFSDYMEDHIHYTKYQRSNREKEQAIIIADASDILTGRNKTFLKIFVFTLQKITQQNNPREITFQLQELVANGMYRSLDTARRAIRTFYEQQSRIQLFQTVRTKAKKKEQGGFLFYNYDITNNFVTLSVNDRFPVVDLLAKQYTVFPRFSYGLGAQAFALIHYVFSLARQNTRAIAEKGFFNISLDAVRNQLGLPAVGELKDKGQYRQLIQRPIERAIAEITEAAQRNQDEYDGTLSIRLFAAPDQGIRTWLEGYLTIRLTGEYSKSFQAIAGKQEKLVAAFETEKAKESAKLAARAEAARRKKG